MIEKIKAQVIRSSQRDFSCRTEKGDVVDATSLGKLLRHDSIVVGDRVLLEPIGGGSELQIVEVVERESEIFRILVREQKKKVTAANCDLLVVLSSVSKPAYKQGFVDRFLVRACQWGIRPIVIFNKMDEHDPEVVDINFEKDRLNKLGLECFEISSLLKDNYKPKYLEKGWNELRDTLKGRIAIFLGQSGVGKSKTISQLSGGEFDLKTKKVGKVGKGSHTTTWSELLDLGLFSVIDSPGIRSFSLEDVDPRELLSYFPDLEEIAIRCKFNDCHHEEGSKGCAFYSDKWDPREKSLIYSRLASFQRIKEEVSQVPFWSKNL